MSGGGWHGAVLHVDVGRRAFERRPIERDVLEAFVGGVGLGAWLCLEAGGAEVAHAFEPAAPLVFASAPLVGTAIATSAKLAVVGRSPLTGLLSDGLTSSDFAVALKRCGVDALVVVGASDTPVEIVIDAGEVDFVSAAALMGRPAGECGRAGFQTAAIGVAGEHLVRFATVSNDGRHAGRGGLGAVMGAKRVKAISIRGSRATPVHEPRAVARRARALAARSLGPATAKYRELGTVANLETFSRLGILPERNFTAMRGADANDERSAQAGAVSEAAKFDPRRRDVVNEAAKFDPRRRDAVIEAPVSETRRSCAACRIGCEHRFHRGPSKSSVRLEYESAWALGPLLGVDDHGCVLDAAAVCDELGLDAISAGGTLAFAMEAAGLGADFGIGFGEGRRVPALLEDIAHRRGQGERLAEGAMRAADAVGLPDLAMHVKGLELPGYDPRALQAMALGLAVGTRGADHNRSGAYELDFSTDFDRLKLAEGDVPRVVEVENRSAALDSLVLCKFLRGAFDDPALEWRELLREVTGVDVDVAGLGDRVATLRKLFNQRAGWRPEQDGLPARLLGEWLDARHLARCITRYNRERGLSDEGRVLMSTLVDFGLEPLLGGYLGHARGPGARPEAGVGRATDGAFT